MIAREKSCLTQDVSAYAMRAGTDATSSCPTLSIYKAGAPRAASPTALYVDSGGTCTPLPMIEGLDLFEAEPAALDTFAKLVSAAPVRYHQFWRHAFGRSRVEKYSEPL